MSGREYHYVITVTWPTGTGQGFACSDGVITALPGQTRQDLYDIVRRRVRQRNGNPPDDRLAVLFLSIEPNDLEAA
jgi:hypothetical protein